MYSKTIFYEHSSHLWKVWKARIQIQCMSAELLVSKLVQFIFKQVRVFSRDNNSGKRNIIPLPKTIRLPCRHFQGSSFFIPPNKRLLNWRQHSFPMLSQSHCTFQILESWPWPQGSLIITWSARNTGKAFWPLINVRFRAAKIRFSQILEYSMHCITLAKERKEGKR